MRAWIFASTDPIVGKDQTGKRFFTTVYNRFKSYGSGPGKYGARSLESCRQKFASISADCQKFKLAFRKVNNCHPTGAVEDEIVSMAAAIHVGVSDKMQYENRGLSHDRWQNARAWRFLRAYPKWELQHEDANAASPSADYATSNRTETNISTERSSVEQTNDFESQTRVTPTAARGTKRGSNLPGRDNAKSARREEDMARAMKDIARAFARKTEVMEQRNAFYVGGQRAKYMGGSMHENGVYESEQAARVIES